MLCDTISLHLFLASTMHILRFVSAHISHIIRRAQPIKDEQAPAK